MIGESQGFVKNSSLESVSRGEIDESVNNVELKADPKSNTTFKKKKVALKGPFNKDSKKTVKKKKFEGKMKAWFQQRKVWQDHVKKHRKDLRNAKPVVDDKPPKLDISSIYDVEILRTLQQNLKAAFDQNQLIVKSLHEVNILSGKTDTFSFNYNRPLFSNYNIRKEEAKKIEKQNMLMSKLVKKPHTRMMTARQYAEDWKKIEAIMENSSQFPLFWKVKNKKEPAIGIASPVSFFRQYVTEKSIKYPDKRPRYLEKLLLMSSKNVNFLTSNLLKSYTRASTTPFLPRKFESETKESFSRNFYKKCWSRRKNGDFALFRLRTYDGDVVENQGFGGTSIYGPYFGSEDFTLKHGERGVLTMYQKIPDRNESQFLITFRKLESLDGQNVVFGKIIKGFHVLDAIESVGSKKTGRPKVAIYISDCDEI